MTSKHNIKDTLIIDYFNKCNTKNILNCSFIAKLNNDKNYNDAIYYNIDKNELNIILSYIPKKYFKDYESWHKIAAAIKNINYDFYDLLDNYSKGHKKYNETQNKYIYDHELNNLNFSWGFLTSLITDEKLNNLIKNLLIKDYKTFDSPKIPDDIKIINDENRYINHELLINSTEKHIILWAMMDKGKTHATEQLYTHLINIKNSSESITRKNIDNILNDKQNQRREFISKNRDFINYIENLNHLENKLNELKKDNQQYNEYEEKINKYKESYTNYRIINENYDTEIYELFKQKDQLFLKNYNPKKKELKY